MVDPKPETPPEAKSEPRAKEPKPDTKGAEQRFAQDQLLARKEISIWIDTYDDIFSDFDPRPYHQRALSVDFLDEARRAQREKTGGQLVLHILAPAAIRSGAMEQTIRKRFKEHFAKHAAAKREEQRAITRKGALFCLAGSLILIIATLIAFYGEETLLNTFLVILLDPAGWFTVWNGMDFLFFKPKELVQETEFYNKMSAAEIRFDSY